MDSLANYSIEFVKLKLGHNNFDYKISDAFFSLKENSLFQQGSVNVHLNIDRKERLINLDFKVDGIVKSECDVCLDSLDLTVNGAETIVIKISDEPKESDGEIIYLSPNDLSINVYDYIYEIICTCIPMVKTCENNANKVKACNAEMLNFLSASSEENSNIEPQTDPRWDKLKKIKD